MIFNFGDESEHIRNMASKANRNKRKPYDYEKEKPEKSGFIPIRDYGKQFFHPSEIDPRTHHGFDYSEELIRLHEKRLKDTTLGKEDVVALATSVGAIVVGLVVLNHDDITSFYDGLTGWAEDKLTSYLNLGVKK